MCQRHAHLVGDLPNPRYLLKSEETQESVLFESRNLDPLKQCDGSLRNETTKSQNSLTQASLMPSENTSNPMIEAGKNSKKRHRNCSSTEISQPRTRKTQSKRRTRAMENKRRINRGTGSTPGNIIVIADNPESPAAPSVAFEDFLVGEEDEEDDEDASSDCSSPVLSEASDELLEALQQVHEDSDDDIPIAKRLRRRGPQPDYTLPPATENPVTPRTTPRSNARFAAGTVWRDQNLLRSTGTAGNPPLLSPLSPSPAAEDIGTWNQNDSPAALEPHVHLRQRLADLEDRLSRERQQRAKLEAEKARLTGELVAAGHEKVGLQEEIARLKRVSGQAVQGREVDWGARVKTEELG